MAKKTPANMSEKRATLYSEKATGADRNACTDFYIEKARFGEALEFLEVTKDADRLDRVRDAALDLGDSFLLARVERIGGEKLGAEVWRRLAETARRNARYLDAYRALDAAGDEEAAEALREQHMPDFESWKPQGK
jgi:hypothetical protein